MNAPRRTAALALSLKRWPVRSRGGLGQLNYLPVGTQIVYNVTFQPDITNPDVQTVQSQISQALAANAGMSVIGAHGSGPGIFGAGSLSMTVLLNQNYTSLSMVQSAIDGKVNLYTNGVISSNASVVNVPASSLGDAQQISTSAFPSFPTTPATGAPASGIPGALQIAPPAGSSGGSWLSSNWPWLVGVAAIGIAGAYVAGRLL